MKKLGYEDGKILQFFMHLGLIECVCLAVLSSGSVISLTSVGSSPSKHNTSAGRSKALSMHSPSTLHRPSSAEMSSAGTSRGIKVGRKRATPESPLRHALRSDGRDSSPVRRKSQWSPVNHEATPGSSEWEYYSQPVPPAMVSGLADKWPAIEKTFITTLKQVFQILREERECICQYFFLRR